MHSQRDSGLLLSYLSRLLFALLAGLSLSTPAVAQDPGGNAGGKIVLPDGAAVPGVLVTISSPEIGKRTTISSENGHYRIAGLPAGTYQVTAELDGFQTVEREVVVETAKEAVAHFQLQLAEIEEEIVVTGQHAAITEIGIWNPNLTPSHSATARTPTVEQFGLVPGGIMVGYWDNRALYTLEQVENLPLTRQFSGFVSGLEPGIEVFIESGGDRYDVYGVYASPTQFAAVIPSEVPEGHASLVGEVTLNGETYQDWNVPVEIHLFQPGLFTIKQDGQGEGIFTDTEYNLITVARPAKPGELVISWGTGGGPAPVDDQGVVFDKRGLYDMHKLVVGGVEVAEPLYIGAAGGFAGGDQGIWEIGMNAPTGCAVPVYTVATKGEVSRMSNVVTMPISADGGPCGDAHGLSSDEIDRLTDGSLKVGTTEILEVVTSDGETVAESMVARLRGENLDTVSYDPPIPLGTCKVGWTPQGFVSPFAPGTLEFGGVFGIQLPGLTITLSEESNQGPYFGLFGMPNTSQLADGEYTIFTSTNFTVDGEPSVSSWTGNFSRDGGRAKDAVREALLAQFQQDGWLSPATVIALAAAAGVGPEVIVQYDIIANHGPFGVYNLTCLMPGGVPELNAVLASVQQQSCDMIGHHLPLDPENTSIVVSFINADKNTLENPGAIDSTSEVIGATFVLRPNPLQAASAITDTSAFATCP